jgi:FkbH-like protein
MEMKGGVQMTTSQTMPEPAADVKTESPAGMPKKKSVKLVVWDLDNTLWEGTLLENDRVRLREEIPELLATLDRRGILFSIASKNDHETALNKLKEFGLDEYFLYPQINWNSKAANIQEIVKSINIGMDAVAFVDDDEFERAEVRHAWPEILIFDANETPSLAERKELIPKFITEDSSRRREMYLADMQRKNAEEKFVGPNEEFLMSLDMHFTIARAKTDDLQRAEELTVRTNQLNTTGYVYSYEELAEFSLSPNHLLLVASLNDKFGTYGKIGLTLIEKTQEIWTIKLLLMSCRVMSRGVGSLLINHLLTMAREAGVRLRGEFRSNGKNRMMLVTYKFSGFKETDRSGDVLVFEHDLHEIQACPEWVRMHILD